MKNRILAMFMAAAVVGTTVLPGMTVDAAKQGKTTGTTYYVSTVDGNDNNDGMSEGKAFYSLDKINELTLKPGDKVLLERGSVFQNGFLHLKGDGSEEAPIVVDSYGKGNLPIIETNGQGIWYQNYRAPLGNAKHKYQGYVSSSVLLYDVEYVEIKNLEITNKAPKIETAYNAEDVMNRTGVAAVAQNEGTLNHIYLDNLYVHDVIGNVYDKHMNNGGIYFTAFQPMDASTGIAKYDDVKIENCYVENTNRWGIAVGYSYTHGQFHGGVISDEKISTYGSTNVVIRNNYVKDAGGDAITLMYCDRPLIEYNISDGAARQINTKDYSATGFGRVAAGIWPWKCKDAIFQYNEAFDTCQNQDGQAWDADYGDGTVYQYNYSHNNGGGSVMFCGGEAINNIFRYNISQNDLGGVINPAGQPDAHVYNNTFFVKEGIDFIRTNMGGGPMVVENNIIYYNGSAPKEENWFKHTNETKTKYDNNLYYNYANVPANDANAIEADPKFADPGKAPTAPLAGVEAGNIKDSIVHERTAFDGYKLASDSPAVNAGKVIKNNGGKDFFGNKVTGTPDIGAFESDAVSLVLTSDVYDIKTAEKTIGGVEAGTTVADFLKNLKYDSGCTIKVMNGKEEVESGIVKGGMSVVLSDGKQEVVYTIVASADNAIKEAVYMMKDKTVFVPMLENNPTTVKELKEGVKVHSTAEVKIVNAEGKEVTTGNIAEGMKLVVQAENGDQNEFTISAKNSYQWALDYAGPQQGNVWFGQMKKSASEYENLTAYDPVYPNWVVDTYFGSGVDLPNHQTPTTETTHGLLSDTTGASKKEGMAMAFRVPKSGKITLAVKDDEPYLRQAGNKNGTVTLSFTKNGEVLGDSYVLEGSNQKADVGIREIEVNKGDWIRVEAKNNGAPTKPSIHVTPIITYVDEAMVEPEQVNRTLLKDTIDYAKSEQEKPEYQYVVPIVKQKLEEALEAAEKVYADENATQAQVDTVCDKLLEMIHYLSYTGNSKSLQALVKAAEDINVDVYTEESVKAFRAALEEAVELLKDENALQYELDAAQQKLQEAMEGLTIIPVDKSKLAKAVKEAQKYVEKLNEYTPQSAELFQGALDAAKAVLDDEKATQEQVEHAFVNLQNAIFNLRLIPNKDKLEELLSKAENIDLSLYTEESGNVLKAAIADAKAIFEDENATEKQVVYASDLLAKAMDGLKTAESKEPTDDKKPSAEQGNAQAGKENASEKKSTAAKTGDTTMMFVWILVMIAGVSTVTVIYKKRKYE